MSDYETRECTEHLKIDADALGTEIANSNITYIYFDIDFTVAKYKESYPDGSNSDQIFEHDLTDVRYLGAESMKSSSVQISEDDRIRLITRVVEMFNQDSNAFLANYAHAESDALVAYSSLEDLIRTAEDQTSSEYLPLPGLNASFVIHQAFVMEQVTGSLDSYGVEAFQSLYSEDGPDNSADWDNFRELRNMIMKTIVDAVDIKIRELGSDEAIVKIDTKSINTENLWGANSSLYDTIEELMHGYIKSKLGA